MKREIKFRALENSGSKFIFGNYNYVKNSPVNGEYIGQHSIHNGIYEELIEVSTLGQFTGIQDKNEKDIYEGDIVDLYTNKRIIEFTKGTFGYYGNNNEWQILGYTNGNRPNNKRWRIIGNIHKNPELI
jgi:uncharacterized phage protein (TIGR01671 family)